MNFAIVGETSGTLPVVEALQSGDEHVVTHACCLGDESAVLAKFPGLRRLGEWEDLLAEETVDAAIVSGTEDAILVPARQIASSGRPLVVVPSPGMTSAFAYELSLVRDENLVPLHPLVPHRMDPAAVRLKELIAARDIGDLIQLRLERNVSLPGNLLRNTDDVETWLQPDADLLRWVGGSFTQVTALYQGKTDAGFASATVNLAGDSATDSAWVLTAGPAPRRVLTVSGTEGTLVLECEQGLSRLLRNGQPVMLDNGRDFSSADEWYARLAAEVSRFTNPENRNVQSAAWTDFTRSHEIVDAHRRSIRRRRTIDLHFETLSERSQFKTQMAAMGCGVLTYTMFGLVAYLVVANAFAPGDEAPAEQVDRFRLLCNIGFVVWILPLVLFLASQFLLGLARPAAGPANDAGPQPESQGDSAGEPV